jgi:thiol:disulfide interchange protein DsbD
MEEYTFPDPQVQQELANVTLLQADVTDNDETDIALLNHFKLFAPPAILFFGTDGRERQEHRLVGFLDADAFLAHVQKAIPR